MYPFDITAVFKSEINDAAWICLALLCGSAILAILARFIPFIRTARTAAAQTGEADLVAFEPGEKLPKASVIVYCFSNEEALADYLEILMNQDYPDYEVILVNEGSYDVSTALAERLQEKYPCRLYVTFIPPESHNLSRRKLALTVGIKAAHGDVVVTTASNCIIPSQQWLSLMMQPFIGSDRTDVVLGYAHINFENLHGAAKWYKEFDATLTACQWLGAAINHYPYRGDSFNLAYRRHLFFEQKGYSKTLHLMNGDDDLFINDISNCTNTDVMIAPDAILTYDYGEAGNRIRNDLKERYQFTSLMLPRMPFLRAGFGSAMQWTATACGIVASVVSLPNLIPLIVACALLAVLNIFEILLYRKAARALGSVC
ncbi:MAG: glycosyltransferase, partial [Muribaculaceae bacterium]|nr:glycosyltransferase [Muribaculaceae bacterium]